MYGLIGKITSKPGGRESLLALLLQGSQEMPGCLSYVVARDTENQDAIWVTEVWTDQASHQASLQLPSVQQTIAQAMPLIAGFEPGIVTQPVGGVGLPANVPT
jgi:quinol monooxygenase YgiN